MDKKERKGVPGELAELMAVSFLLLLLCAAGLVMYFARPDQATAFLEEQPQKTEGAEAERTEQQLKLMPQEESSVILLPLSSDQKISCDTAARRLTVSMQGAPEEEEPWVKADKDLLVSASLYRSPEESLYVFELREMCAAGWEKTPEGLKITLVPVAELDERCFVVILECADDSVPEELGRRTGEKLAETGENIVLLHPGPADAPKTEEEREALIESCRADAYIRLEAAEKAGNGFVTQALCDTQYYIPGLDSVVLADLCESSLLKEIGGPAGDITELKENDPLRSLKIPACVLRLGKSAADAGTEGAADIKKQNAYVEKAAEGLKEALVKAAKLVR